MWAHLVSETMVVTSINFYFLQKVLLKMLEKGLKGNVLNTIPLPDCFGEVSDSPALGRG